MLAGFCHTSFDLFSDSTDILECLKKIESLAVKELSFLKYQVTKKELIRIMKEINTFHDSNFEGKTYVVAFMFYQAIVNDIITSGITISEKRIERLNELHGLIETVSIMISDILESETNYNEELLDRDIELAGKACVSFWETFK